ncbi:glutamate-5-semialdehyde dehydrogenase [Parvibaculum sp.]|uniref:glutamate-5-semialdehyde dehydrogenase n=1 Tax=Parvibaculum sp. TaxID=2024848 RepID=UPI000C58ABC4|nr:glutamate-5-semialdehyde dehydrogenase [Parvibaculum sp.]MAU60994.1 glutamate-5-semialdehyde dehydrogenase [Parvibaculum sp.]MBO6668610.1 glutamate-5-semialdehyde dehydrogenase [Parvibaculum sp.]MBO6691070.1 glutamate-5-semialdehyde dehydrogenase [Parvibaculum sp.]MBO6714286.1 glutamate-5-semialdehyde dehydrogenase [Parvibaculum sp.]
MAGIGRKAREAATMLATAPTKQKDAALLAAAMCIRANVDDILAANEQDVADAKKNGLTPAMIDRLTLDTTRVEGIAKALEEIAALPDPVGSKIAEWDRPNGLHIERVRVPLGVIGIIYESRPNVTADAGALCLKAGNAAVLRGGSEASRSNKAIHASLVEGILASNLPEASIQLVPVTDRGAVGEMLKGLGGNLDVIVPRGGKSLVARVQEEARVPVFAHLEGVCHVYVDGEADLDMARDIALNAKLRRTGICGAAETLLVDEACAATHLAPLVKALLDAGCEVRGDEATQKTDARVKAATEEDWYTEYLDSIIAVRVVNGIGGAIAHIRKYGSSHTEAIVTGNQKTADRFFAEVDSAILLHNASTQFADGGEFGMGAEIGIATGKFHARGPVGVEQLTSFKYLVRGSGQVRP